MQDATVAPQSLQYVSEKTLSKMIGVSRSTLQKDRHFRRGLPYIKRGKLVLYKLEDVEQSLDARRIVPAEWE